MNALSGIKDELLAIKDSEVERILKSIVLITSCNANSKHFFLIDLT